MKSLSNLQINFGILFIAALLFIPFLGNVHLFDWDEINFAESAREMLLTGDYFRVQINFQPFWEKPPLFFWMQVVSMRLWGINEFAARFPNAIIGVITLLVLYNIGRANFDKSFGIFWVLAYLGSFLPHLYFKSGIIDPTFNLFIFLGIYFLHKTTVADGGNTTKNSAFAGIFIGLAILTKGPVALLIALLSIGVYIIIKRAIPFSIKNAVVFFTIAGLISFIWFGLETVKNGPWFIKEFIVYQIRLFKTQDAGHGGPFFYHFIVLLIGCFPASIFIFKAFANQPTDSASQKDFKTWMIISFFVVLILFSIVKTKIVHYSSFCYFPLTFLAAYTLNKAHHGLISFKKGFTFLHSIIGILIAIILIIFPLLIKNKDIIINNYSHLIKDKFALANLEAQVTFSGFEILIGIFYLGAIVFLIFSAKPIAQKAIFLFISTCLVIQLTLYLIVPKVERISQGAAIDFFKSMENQNAYVDVYGYKSYAHLFYTKKKPNVKPESRNEGWLLEGAIDKPVFLVTKITNQNLDNVPGFKIIGSKNGFVFYKREK